MAPSFWQIAIVLLLLVVFFGRGKISSFMGDLAQGIKSFKKGMAEEEVADAKKPAIDAKAEPAANDAVVKNDEAVKG